MANTEHRKLNKRFIVSLVCGVLFMFGFSYMLVPLYNLLCKKTGINGKSVRSAAVVANDMQVDRTRTIDVEFVTSVNGHLNVNFVPVKRHVQIHPGEVTLVYFLAENHTNQNIVTQAIPSITPSDAARFLRKTECFCFTQQAFSKNERAKMPVYFFVDPAVPRNIKEMTLSYTLFDAAGFVKKQDHFTKGRIDL